jgi:hypothetical protein
VTKQEKYVVAGGAIALVAWWWWSHRAPAPIARVVKTLIIDDNVYSPTFGLPIPN